MGTLLAAGPVAGQMGLPLSPLAQTPQEQGDQAGLRLRREGFVPGQCPAESRCQLLLMTEDPKEPGFTSDEASSRGCFDAVYGRSNSVVFSHEHDLPGVPAQPALLAGCPGHLPVHILMLLVWKTRYLLSLTGIPGPLGRGPTS